MLNWIVPHPHSFHRSQAHFQARLDEIPAKPNQPMIIIHLVYFDFSSPSLSAPIYLDDDDTHLLTSFEGDYWYVFTVFYSLKLASLTSIDSVHRDFDFSSPLISAPIYLVNDDTHLLTSFGGDYWYVFKVFYSLKLASLTTVDSVYQISPVWAPHSLHLYISTTTMCIH